MRSFGGTWGCGYLGAIEISTIVSKVFSRSQDDLGTLDLILNGVRLRPCR